ncbi:MAG TPA: rod shape-determining protein MreC [Terriglobales bacterium]|jgi:rod shape-determining protein MreC
MDTFLGRFKNLIFLAAILFAQVVGLAVQVRRPSDEGETRLIRVWAISAVTPIETAVVHSQDWVQNIFKNYAYLRGVRRENRDLRAEIQQMKIQQTRMEEDARMARRVQALLGFKEQYVDSTVAAQVIGTSGSEQSRVLYIDKGSKDGIKTDMAVITPAGIVGKIVQVADNWSQVLPINDQFSGVGAALKDSRLQGILKGTTSGATTLQYIMSDEKVRPGEDVITSGGDRIFPKGLPVGTVASVEPGKDLFLNIRVTPSAQLNQIEEVLVVTKITEKMPDANDLRPLRASDILAERLPTVPTKAEVDAAGNAKPQSGAVPPATTPGAPNAATHAPHAAMSGTNSVKPVSGSANSTKPAATTATPRTSGPTKPKAAGTTRPTATGAAASTTTSPNHVRIVDNDSAALPPAKKKTPASEAPPPQAQPATPATGAPPQQ